MTKITWLDRKIQWSKYPLIKELKVPKHFLTIDKVNNTKNKAITHDKIKAH